MRRGGARRGDALRLPYAGIPIGRGVYERDPDCRNGPARPSWFGRHNRESGTLPPAGPPSTRELRPPIVSRQPPERPTEHSRAAALAPGFTLVDTAGEIFSLEDYRGQVIVVEMMTTWCSICAATAANTLAPLQAQIDNGTLEGVAIISVGADRDDGHSLERAVVNLRLQRCERIGSGRGADAAPGRHHLDHDHLPAIILERENLARRIDQCEAGRQRRSSRVLGGAFGRLPGNYRGPQLACARWPGRR